MSLKGGTPLGVVLPPGYTGYPYMPTSRAPAGLGAIYDAPNFPTPTAAVALAVGTLSAVPHIVGQGVTLLSHIGFNHTVNGGAGSVARVGLWRSNVLTRRATTLLFDTGSIATDAGASTVPRMTALAAPVAVTPGELLWLSYCCGVAAPTITVTYNLGAGLTGGGAIFGEAIASGNVQWGWSVAFAFAALPATFPAAAVFGLTAGANTPVLKVRYSA